MQYKENSSILNIIERIKQLQRYKIGWFFDRMDDIFSQDQIKQIDMSDAACGGFGSKKYQKKKLKI